MFQTVMDDSDGHLYWLERYKYRVFYVIIKLSQRAALDVK